MVAVPDALVTDVFNLFSVLLPIAWPLFLIFALLVAVLRLIIKYNEARRARYEKELRALKRLWEGVDYGRNS